ncbi:MAG: hypothetical protein WKF83_03040 [Nocardioidaceae bacterium]
MTPDQLSGAIVSALSDLVGQGRVVLPDGVPATVRIERPKVKQHGDYATNVALQLAKKAGADPRDFAQLLADELGRTPGVASAEVAGPGFLNIRVEAGAQGRRRAADRRRRRCVRHVADARRSQGQPRVHLGQPDRPDPPRCACGGRRSVTASAES